MLVVCPASGSKSEGMKSWLKGDLGEKRVIKTGIEKQPELQWREKYEIDEAKVLGTA